MADSIYGMLKKRKKAMEEGDPTGGESVDKMRSKKGKENAQEVRKIAAATNKEHDEGTYRSK